MNRIGTLVVIFIAMIISLISCGAKRNPTSKNTPPIEDPNFVVTKDTVSMYGPNSITRNLLQDKNGNIWFATWQGVIKYDGIFFTNVTLKESLKHFHVWTIFEDKAGDLWFGTVGGGVYRYRPSANDKQRISYFTMNDGLAGNFVWNILQDKTGNTWFATNNGVSRYDSKSFTNFTTSDGLSHNSVYTLLEDKSGKIWIGTQGGINYYDTSRSSDNKYFSNFTNEKKLPFLGVRSMIQDKNGMIWLGCQGGLYNYDPKSEKLNNISTNITSSILEDKTRKLWLSGSEPNSSEMILSRYDATHENTFTRITTDLQIFGVIEDKNGNIWYGTAKGARRYDPVFAKFSDFLEH